MTYDTLVSSTVSVMLLFVTTLSSKTSCEEWQQNLFFFRRRVTCLCSCLDLGSQMMEQRINSEVYMYVEVLNKPMNFPLIISPSKEMGDRMRQRKRSDSRQGQRFFLSLAGSSNSLLGLMLSRTLMISFSTPMYTTEFIL